MNRKFQVFISSTYRDLLKERQTAVQAVLDAGHIPAGMELFAAGDEAQLSVIKRWIDESDIYMLILGVRYGTLEPTSKKGYTHIEYEYAVSKGKPVFAVYLAETPFNDRVKELALELATEDRKGYALFRDLVKSKMCSEFSDPRDITIAVLKTLNDFARKPELQAAGWIRGQDVPDTSKLTAENAQLNADVARLTTELSRLNTENSHLRAKTEESNQVVADERIGKFGYRQLVATLGSIRVSSEGASLLDVFVKYENDFVLGVIDPDYDRTSNAFLFTTVAPKLSTFGLLEPGKVQGQPGVRTSELGNVFLARLAIERAGAT